MDSQLAAKLETFEDLVQKMHDGQAPNNFYWGDGLAPPGDWRTMFAKVGGCLLHKAEVIATQFELDESNDTVIPRKLILETCLDLASCCAKTSKRPWCIKKAAPVYNRLKFLLHRKGDGGLSTERDKEDLIWAFAELTAAAAERFNEVHEGYSERAELLLTTCPSGVDSCSASQIGRLRRF